MVGSEAVAALVYGTPLGISLSIVLPLYPKGLSTQEDPFKVLLRRQLRAVGKGVPTEHKHFLADHFWKACVCSTDTDSGSLKALLSWASGTYPPRVCIPQFEDYCLGVLIGMFKY